MSSNLLAGGMKESFWAELETLVKVQSVFFEVTSHFSS